MMLFQAIFLILGPLASDAVGLDDACDQTNCAMVALQMNQEKLYKATQNSAFDTAPFEDWPAFEDGQADPARSPASGPYSELYGSPDHQRRSATTTPYTIATPRPTTATPRPTTASPRPTTTTPLSAELDIEVETEKGISSHTLELGCDSMGETLTEKLNALTSGVSVSTSCKIGHTDTVEIYDGDPDAEETDTDKDQTDGEQTGDDDKQQEEDEDSNSIIDDDDYDDEISTTPDDVAGTTTPINIKMGRMMMVQRGTEVSGVRRELLRVAAQFAGGNEQIVKDFLASLDPNSNELADLLAAFVQRLKEKCTSDPICDVADLPTVTDLLKVVTTPAPKGPGLKGDPHAVYHGHKVTFSLPEHYVKLFEQDDVAVFGSGGAPSPKFASQNFMYSVLIRLGGEEFIRVTQKKDAELFASQQDEEAKRVSQLNISLAGTPDWAQTVGVGKSKVATLEKDGFQDVRVHAEREKVTVGVGELKFLVRSTASQWEKNIPNHLDFVVQEGLDSSKSTGVLPELWGFTPMSEKVKRMVKEHGGEGSFLLSLASSMESFSSFAR